MLHAIAKRAAGADKAGLMVVPEGVGTDMLRAQPDLSGRIIDWIGSPVGGVLPTLATP